MTPQVAAILGGLIGCAISAMVVLWLHERREFRRQDQHERAARDREDAARTRHEALMKALADNRALTLAAVNQRNRLDVRVRLLEAAANNHAELLEQLGAPGAARVEEAA